MRKKLTFADLSEHVQNVFAERCTDGVTPEENFEGFRQLSYDLNHGVELFDSEGNKISKHEAEKEIRNFVFAIMEIDENSSKRDRKRALKKHGAELFAVIEEEIDVKVETGFKESEFFNDYVESRNIQRGDRN